MYPPYSFNQVEGLEIEGSFAFVLIILDGNASEWQNLSVV